MSLPQGVFSAGGSIARYQAVFQPFLLDGHTLIAFRTFERNGAAKILAIDPDTLETSEMAAGRIDFKAPVEESSLSATPFHKALSRHTALPCPLQNDGLTESDTSVCGSFLTVDLCPSVMPFEKRLFEGLIDLWRDRGEPAPVGLAVTGVWADRHEEELQWLIGQVRERKLRITWINHSYNHPYDRDKALDETFLLTPGTNFEEEILSTEILLLEHDLVPSVFFRFPGLVSNCDLIRRLKALSLIPVGSRAWLAKGETPVEGSIILVHGNGNEPAGIDMLLDLFHTQKDAFTRGGLTLQPLNAALAVPLKTAASGSN